MKEHEQVRIKVMANGYMASSYEEQAPGFAIGEVPFVFETFDGLTEWLRANLAPLKEPPRAEPPSELPLDDEIPF